ncbi:MAG: S8 family serine peptidase, partial [Dehalococcoidia bacterium]
MRFVRMFRCAALAAAIGIGLLVADGQAPHAIVAASPQSILTAVRAELARRELPAPQSLPSGPLAPRWEDSEPGQASVKFAVNIDAATAAEELSAAGANLLDYVADLNVYRVSIPSAASQADVRQKLRSLSGVERVEPVLRLVQQFHPNDPLYASSQQYLPGLLHAEQAWDIQQGDQR